MKKFLIILIIILPFYLSADPAVKKYPFLFLSPNPRFHAMADCFAAVSGDINNIFYNPAGVYSDLDYDVSLSYLDWIQSLSYLNMAAKLKIPDLDGDLGLGFGSLVYGDMSIIEESGGILQKSEKSFSPASLLFLGHYSRKLMEKLSAGINLKIIHEKINEYNTTQPGVDTGVLYHINSKLGIGISCQNIGLDASKINSGISFNIPVSLWKITSVLVCADMNYLGDEPLYYGLGTEITLYRIFSLRTGYKINRINPAFCIGAGIHYKSYQFHYSFANYDDLGYVNYLGLQIKPETGTTAPVKTEKKPVKKVRKKLKGIFRMSEKGNKLYIQLSDEDLILFNYNEAVITEKGREILLKIAELIKKENYEKVYIFGYTDNTGEEKNNLVLSENRAYALYKFLILQRLNKEKLSYRGLGERNPITSNDTESGRARNRRCELIILKNTGVLGTDEQLKDELNVQEEKSKIVIQLDNKKKKLFNFETGSINKTGYILIDKSISVIKNQDYKRIIVKVQLSEKKYNQENINLSLKLANNVCHYLIMEGIPSDKITLKGYTQSDDSFPDNICELAIIKWQGDENEQFRYNYFMGLDAFIKEGYMLAVEYWEKALALDPDNQGIRANIEKARIKAAKQ